MITSARWNIVLLVSIFLMGCGSDSGSSAQSDDNGEVITEPLPEEPQLPEPTIPETEEISQLFEAAIGDNLYIFKYYDQDGQVYVAMVPKMARLQGSGIFKLMNEQLHAVQIVDDYILARAFSDLTLPFLNNNAIGDISGIIAQSLNISTDNVYAVNKFSGAIYLPTEDQGYNNSYEYTVNGQSSVLRLNASDYPVDNFIPFAGEFQGSQSIELDYQQENTPYFTITVRLFADTQLVGDVSTDIYLKGVLNQVTGSNDLYQLDNSW